MKRSLFAHVVVVCMLVAVPWSSMGSERNKEIRDMAGRVIGIPYNPEKIICLGPGALRLISYLGVQDKVVGIEGMEKQMPAGRPYRYANQSLADLPVIGPGGPAAINKEPDLEAVLSVKPQLIFITSMEPFRVDNLQRKLGIPVVLLSYGTLGGFDEVVYESLLLAGKIMGVEKRAGEIVSYLERARKDLVVRASRSSKENRPLVYVGGVGFKGTHGLESTDADYIPFAWTGAKNGAKQMGGRAHFFADREKILALNPDVVFVDAAGLGLFLQDYGRRPDFYTSMKAFQSGKTYILYPYNFYTTNIECALADAYAVGKILYPAGFRDIDLRKKADEIFHFFVGAPVNNNMEKDYGLLGRQLTLTRQE